VYLAFTNKPAIQGWLCNNAQVDASEKGRLYLHWNEGYYACGEFTELKENESLAFNWQGRGEPAQSTVQVKLAAENGGTQVTLTHAELGTGEAWEKAREEIAKGWENGLENLKAVLETGLDKRVFDRPLLGVFPTAVVDENMVARLNLPVSTGIHISGAVPGTKSEEAGLQADDVLFSIQGVELVEFGSFGEALEGLKAGDEVELVFYRDGEKRTLQLELSRRAIPDIADTAAGLAEQVRQSHAQLDAELDDLLANVSDAEAAAQPTEGEWSVMQVLAHLITSERAFQIGIYGQINKQALNAFANNHPAPLAALMAVYPTLDEMVAAFKRAEAETVALVENLPEEVVARKADYLNLGTGLLWFFPNHNRGHYAQMGAALEAVRKG
jgi:uncharacterized protein YndB with AHSA1/START domain/uncharacterized damage-inducible protein DinB